jgi:hypothetical protein
MKTRIVLKSFEALSFTAFVAGRQNGGETPVGGATVAQNPARQPRHSASQAVQRPGYPGFFTSPDPHSARLGLDKSALNDI